MISVSNYRYLRMFAEVSLFALLTVAALALLSGFRGRLSDDGRPPPRRPAQGL